MNSNWQQYSNVLRKLMKGISIATLCLFGVHAYADSNPDFWLAEKADQKIWLLGSIHVGTQSMYPLPENIMHAWQQADQLILETDISDQNLSWFSKALLPEGKKLDDVLSTDDLTELKKIANKYQLSLPRFEQYQPWFVALSLQQEAIRQLGYQSDLGIDSYFLQEAKNKAKDVAFLETPEEQINFLANMGALQKDFLKATLTQIEQIENDLPRLIQAWETGNREQIEKLLEEDDSSPELTVFLEQKLLNQRNTNWVKQFIASKERHLFVVVGAMHLYRNEGLIMLLKKQGYQLTHLQLKKNK